MTATPSNQNPTGQSDDHMEQLERSISELGAAILKLKNEHEAEDADIASELEERFATLRKEYDELKLADASSTDFSDKAAESWEQAKTRVSGAYDDFKTYVTSEETAKQWKTGAKEVGDGVGKAWNELYASFERAYQRFQDRRKDSSS